MKKALAALALGTLTLAAEPNSSQAVLKHREHNGIGYDTGYTTGELFLAPKWKNNLLPFMDLRGHVFDNGKFATNAGIGLRYNWSEATLGGNFYYDFREASNINPHQLAGGLEFLWKYMDIRVNGYGPIASTKFEKTPKFVKFSGNSALFDRRLKAALPMIDGEIGVPFGHRCGDWSMYGALGPYYLFKKAVNGINLGKAWGGQGRVELNLVERYKMTALATYDEIFKWTVQGSVAVSFPFRKRSETQNSLCAARNQLPYRQEIIPIQCEDVRSVPPFNIIFVNNTSSSNGTAESPYPTLALAEANSAPGDVIYVFRGDGTATGMSAGITLQDNQRFHGTGAPMDLDGFVVPALTFRRPTIRNAGGNAVTLANSNTVAGFNIVSSTGDGILKTEALSGSYVIANNSINTVTGGIQFISSAPSQVIISGNRIFNTSGGNGGMILNSLDTGTILAVVMSNDLPNNSDNPSIRFKSDDTSQIGGLIARNTIGTNNSKGIFCQATDSSTQNAIIKGNTVAVNNASNAQSSLNCSSISASTLTFQAKANTFSKSFPVVYLETSSTSQMTGFVERNRVFNPTNQETISIFPIDSSQMNLTISQNFISGDEDNATILLNPTGGPDTFIANLIVNNNTILSQNEEAFSFNNLAGGMDTISFFDNVCISEKSNVVNNENGGLMILDIFNNVMFTNEANSLNYTGVDASTLTCTSIFGNQTNGALDLSATAPAALQVESSTATAEGVVRDNTFKGGISTIGNVTFVDPGTCP